MGFGLPPVHSAAHQWIGGFFTSSRCSMSDYPTTETDHPLFRHTDPATSRKGAEYLTMQRGSKAALMFERIKKLGSATANEAARECVGEHGGMGETYRKRTKDLERLGLIRVSGWGRCKISGRNAQVYELVPGAESRA